MRVRIFFISAMFFLLAMYGFCGQAICQEKWKPHKGRSTSLNQKAGPRSSIHPESAAIPWDTGGNETVVRPKSSEVSGAGEKAGTRNDLFRNHAVKEKATSGMPQ